MYVVIVHRGPSLAPQAYGPFPTKQAGLDFRSQHLPGYEINAPGKLNYTDMAVSIIRLYTP